MSRENSRMGFCWLSDQEIFDMEQEYAASHYNHLKFCPREWKGVWLYGSNGEKTLDCLACYSAVNQGHHHPKIVKALIDALNGNYAGAVSNVVFSGARALFSKKIAAILPQLGSRFGDCGNKVLQKNGGVESFETAVKMCRAYGAMQKGIPDGLQRIIVFRNNFHGRTYEALAASTNANYKKFFGVRTDAYINEVEFGSLDAVERILDPFNTDVCGIIVEPMQGEGGMYPPSPGFLKGLREIADANDLLLIFDEIQVGLGRTGKMFAFEHEGVVPDGIILGKALSGGLIPVSAFVCNSALMDLVFWPGRDGSTYGGYSLACVAGIPALEVFEEEGLVGNAALMGALLKEKFEDIASRSKRVKEVRGKGLFIGVEVKDGNAFSYCQQLLKLGLFANDSHGHTIRISPPLIITPEHVDYIVERMEKVLVG
ncbi:MAG: aspartate aminotransferase family protein [Candidatus Portnoybacteria bacterium]|nr:aspartate aminotransferase family protein [Candidatus Portnoybacteria bacterium]